MKDICIVGCGQIARMYAKKLSGRARLRFVSRTPESAERLNARARGAGVFRNFTDALERSDALIICSPPKSHKEQTIAAITAGKPVLVEKPLCIDRDELAEIERALLANPGGSLMIGENYYYKPSLLKTKELIASGSIGEIRSIRIRRRFTNRISGWRQSYGALIEGGIHYVATISALMGDQSPLSIEAQFPDKKIPDQKAGPERSFILRLGYLDGKSAELDYSWETRSFPHGFFQTSIVEGTKGSIELESNGLWVSIASESIRETFYPSLRDLLGQRGMVEDFLRMIEEGTPPLSDFQRAKRDLSIVFDAYDQRRERSQAAFA